jgi:hypothetical protein
MDHVVYVIDLTQVDSPRLACETACATLQCLCSDVNPSNKYGPCIVYLTSEKNGGDIVHLMDGLRNGEICGQKCDRLKEEKDLVKVLRVEQTGGWFKGLKQMLVEVTAELVKATVKRSFSSFADVERGKEAIERGEFPAAKNGTRYGVHSTPLVFYWHPGLATLKHLFDQPLGVVSVISNDRDDHLPHYIRESTSAFYEQFHGVKRAILDKNWTGCGWTDEYRKDYRKRIGIINAFDAPAKPLVYMLTQELSAFVDVHRSTLRSLATLLWAAEEPYLHRWFLRRKPLEGGKFTAEQLASDLSWCSISNIRQPLSEWVNDEEKKEMADIRKRFFDRAVVTTADTFILMMSDQPAASDAIETRHISEAMTYGINGPDIVAASRRMQELGEALPGGIRWRLHLLWILRVYVYLWLLIVRAQLIPSPFMVIMLALDWYIFRNMMRDLRVRSRGVPWTAKLVLFLVWLGMNLWPWTLHRNYARAVAARSAKRARIVPNREAK